MATFPIARLVLMLIRQISKPISKIIRARAKSNPTFRRYVCLPPAHMYLWVERQINIKYYGQAPEQSPVYVEKKAIKLGANLLGEAFLFTVAATFMTLEYFRNRKKRQRRAVERGMEDLQLRKQIQDQTILAEQQEAEIRELRRTVYKLELLAVQKDAGGKR